MTASPSTRSSLRSGGALSARKQIRVAVNPRLTVNTAEAAIDAAKAGLGIARVLSYQAEASLNDGSLRLILEAYRARSHSREPGASGGPSAAELRCRAFIALAGPRLRKRLKGLERLKG